MTVINGQNPLQATTGTVDYTRKPAHGPLYRYVYEGSVAATAGTAAEQAQKSTNLDKATTQVRVEDVRPIADQFSLEKNGFILRRLAVPDTIDWENKAEVSNPLLCV